MRYEVEFNNRHDEYSTSTWKDYHNMVINALSELINIKIGISPTIIVVDNFKIIVELDIREYNKYILTTPLNKQYDITQIDWLYITLDEKSGTCSIIDFDGFYIEEIIEWFPEWHKVSC